MAFCECRNLNSVEILDSCEYIGESCFVDTSISRIKIPSNTYISKDTLWGYISFIELGKNCTIFNLGAPRNLFLVFSDTITIINYLDLRNTRIFIYFTGLKNNIDPELYHILNIDDAETIYTSCNYVDNYFFGKNSIRIKYSTFVEKSMQNDMTIQIPSEVIDYCSTQKTFENHIQQKLFSTFRDQLLYLSPTILKVRA